MRPKAECSGGVRLPHDSTSACAPVSVILSVRVRGPEQGLTAPKMRERAPLRSPARSRPRTTRGAAETDTADREVAVSRVIDAPRELVFSAFTEVRPLARWCGPDGTDYPEWIQWREIVAPERITMLHGEFADDPVAFESVLTFTPDAGGTTVEFRTLFVSREQRDEAVEKYHAIEGGQQTLGNLADYVAGL